MGSVRSRRPSRLAAARQAATQTLIVEAAAGLFAERGYVGTTIEEIAARAGVAVQTIYNAIGSKRAVLSRVLDLSASGPHAPTTVPEFLGSRIRSEPDAERIVETLADWFAEVNERTATIFGVIRQAAAVDPEVAAFQTERARQRLAGYTDAARELAGRGALRPGLEPEDAGALIWTLGNPDVYRFLVTEHGWPPERYRIWIEGHLRSGLLRVDGSKGLPRRPAR
jgi:AcrR family transcriptional regulator